MEFLKELETIIQDRKVTLPKGSYTSQLFNSGLSRIAQKVGEEGIEVVIAAMKKDKTELANEAADLVFHLLVLLAQSDMQLSDVLDVLKKRHK